MVDILFQNTTIYHMSIDSNAFEMIELYGWIHNPKFNQKKKVAISVRVMIIENINLEKYLINGTIPKKYLPSISMPILKYTSSK